MELLPIPMVVVPILIPLLPMGFIAIIPMGCGWLKPAGLVDPIWLLPAAIWFMEGVRFCEESKRLSKALRSGFGCCVLMRGEFMPMAPKPAPCCCMPKEGPV